MVPLVSKIVSTFASISQLPFKALALGTGALNGLTSFWHVALTAIKVYTNDTVFIDNRATDEGGAVLAYNSKWRGLKDFAGLNLTVNL